MTTNKKMLLVDDDEMLRHTLVEHLQIHEEFTIDEAMTGADALQLVKGCIYDIILLNVGLPDMDGRDVCRRLRRNDVTSPIILLSGMDSAADIILGLNSGANDYVTKPFRLDVLLARIRAQLRHYVLGGDLVYTIGPYTFRPRDKVLISETTKRKTSLTAKETTILRYLCRMGDKPVSQDVLLADVWGYKPDIDTHTLQTHIYRLRRKIENDPSKPKILLLESEGYRLVR